MMYGHVEGPDDLLDHFDAIRDLQDLHGGFTAFVPWSFKPGNTLLEKWIKQHKGPNTYLRMLAAARLYLDNFPHVQASWFSEGKRAGQIALHFGADDWGGTLFEENVHRAPVAAERQRVVVHVHQHELPAGLLVDAAPVTHRVLECLVRVGVRPGDRVAETLRELPVERLAKVPAHHVDAEGERQARVALPGLAEVEDPHQPQATGGAPSLLN